MTPKEKAKELVYRFFKMFGGANKIQDDFEWSNAKDSALIAVDEIIKASPTNPTMDGIEDAQGHFTLADAAEALIFWEQVKTEIEKL